jgi:acetoin utilization protein AcuC
MTSGLRQLAGLERRYTDPMAVIDWQRTDSGKPWLPPELLSLSGLAVQRDMTPEQIRRLSQVDFARLCAAGLWVEGLLMHRLTAAPTAQLPAKDARLLLQEVREEAGHGLMFLEMIDRAGLSGVGLLGDTRLLSWVARRLDPDSPEFWAMVYLGEAITDSFALKALKLGGERICPLARDVLRFHHRDEARHMAAAKAFLKARCAGLSGYRRRRLKLMIQHMLPRFLTATLYPTEASLGVVGLPRPEAVLQDALACPRRRAMAETCAASALRTIQECLERPRPPAGRDRRPHGFGAQVLFVGSEVYRRAAYGKNHPLAIPRIATVMDLCRHLGWLGAADFVDSPTASEAQLLRFHDRSYLDALRRAEESGRADRATRERFALGTLENPIFPGMYERAATSVGGSILAAEIALRGGLAYHPSGGTHHGRPDRASGFCYFNDPVFCILTLLDGGLERVFYVDLDAHFCDGVQDAFADDDRVFTLSIHEAGRWPYGGAVADRAGGAARNLPVPAGFNDSELAFLMANAVLPLGRAFGPQAVVVTCGADGLAGDPLSRMELSNRALWQAVQEVTALAPRAVVLGGGGYNPWTVSRCWAGLWGRLRGDDTEIDLPPDAKALLFGLDCDLVDEDERPEDWFTRLIDRPNLGPVRGQVSDLVPAVMAA